jgi:hypothetical protein
MTRRPYGLCKAAIIGVTITWSAASTPARPRQTFAAAFKDAANQPPMDGYANPIPSLMGLLEAGNVVLRDALRILGVLRLGAGVAGVRNAVRVEGRTRGSAGVARRDAPCLSGTNGLIGLTLRPCYRMDIGGQSQAGGGYDQGSAKHHRHDKMFHGVLPKQSVLGKRRPDLVSIQLIAESPLSAAEERLPSFSTWVVGMRWPAP